MGRSNVAHAWAPLLSGSCSPGIVAQPCLPTYSPRCHELSSFSATSFTAFAGSRPDWTTQIGARRFTTASWAVVSAVARAVPPVTHPPQLNPTIIVTTAVATHDQKSSVFVGRAALQRCPTLNRPLSWSMPRLLHPVLRWLVDARRGAPGGASRLWRHSLTAPSPSP